jgi:cytochrome c
LSGPFGEPSVHRFLTVIFGVAGLLGMLTIALAAESHTPDQAKALVEKAAEYLKSEGKGKALAAFSDPNGGFVDGGLYLAVLDNQ